MNEIALTRRTLKDAVEQILVSESPELLARTIPAQSIYISMKRRGLASSVEVIDLLSRDQLQLLLDFDLWHGDRFSEDQIWDWLELPDAENDLSLLQRILPALDLKCLCILISRHVESVTFDEPTENPPAPHYFTPDKGHTWIHITLEDDHKQFLLARLLALIFETDANLFYKLLQISTLHTQSVLEEEAFEERDKRMLAEGIPDREMAFHLNEPLQFSSVQFNELEPLDVGVSDLKPIRPLIYSERLPKILQRLAQEIRDFEVFEAELSLIMNGALVHFGTDLGDMEEVELVTLAVRGAACIGLELCERELKASPIEAYSKLGLRRLYRIGLSRLV
ncbi:MAG: hypothetical protein KDD64_16760, partial [Bdellovibrionales bacterium]|nr:hypothetical protein [Bdellovibrionales bacterium]